jgi:hypothetical protein
MGMVRLDFAQHVYFHVEILEHRLDHEVHVRETAILHRAAHERHRVLELERCHSPPLHSLIEH